jgi:hypothetical protein
MRPRKNGYYFVEGMPDGSIEPAAQARGKGAVGWEPYKLWVGDLWECPDCHARVVCGVTNFPIAERHHPDFMEKIAALSSGLLVKDC